MDDFTDDFLPKTARTILEIVGGLIQVILDADDADNS